MTEPQRSGYAGDEVWVGLDLGTSGAKAVALGSDGSVVARALAGYPTSRPQTQAAEQDPALWLSACTDVLARLRESVRPSAWRGIALSAMLPTLVVLDREHAPLGPAVTWEDARAERDGERLREALGGEWLYERTGQWLDGRYLLPMYARLARAEPTLIKRVHHLAGAKDMLFAWLTGELLTDPSTAAGYGAYDVHSGGWLTQPLDELEAQLGAPLPALPDLAPSTTLRPLGARAGRTLGLPVDLPVCLGAADSVLGALGLGVQRPGELAYLTGTSSVVLAISQHWIQDPRHRYLLTPPAHAGGYGLEMDLLAAGSALHWLSRLLGGGRDEAQLLAAAAARDPSSAPAFLPYLAPGEQGALWNPDLYGTVAGLHLGHDGLDLARGLLNGLLLETRRCVEVLGQAGVALGEIRAGGWCASDAAVCSELADCCGIAVSASAADARESSALGAARLLAQALGDRLESARAGPRVEPDVRRAAAWDELFERHQRVLDAIAEAYRPGEVLCAGS